MVNPGRRLAWAITGAGHYLEEAVSLMVKLSSVDVFVSAAGWEVVGAYGLRQKLAGIPVYRQGGASSPIIGKLYNGEYGLLVIAPATANSVAKFVLGIADALVPNLFAHAGKCRLPCIIMPTDNFTHVTSKTVRGTVDVFPRPIDLEHVRNLKEMDGVKVVNNPEELAVWLEQYL